MIPDFSLCEDFNENKLPLNGIIEIKEDGGLIRWTGTELISRRGEIVTKRFPDVIPFLPKDCALDMEMCVFGSWEPIRASKFENGYKKRCLLKNSKSIELCSIDYPCTAYVFDCLSWKGKDLRNLPFSERRKYLEKIGTIKDDDDTPRVIVAEQYPMSSFDELKRLIDKHKLEGVVVKDLDASYSGKRSFSMMKWKNYKDAVFKILRTEKTDDDGFVAYVELQNGEEQRVVINDRSLQVKATVSGASLKVGYLNLTDDGKLRQPFTKDVIEPLVAIASSSKKKNTFCVECGATYQSDSVKFCSECGTKRMQVVN